ncbi:DNA (cytosine-5-)-methyltransferase [Lysobacteraceae bacterium NML91-0213]|nr:DNA (cytosine-5-)-methyltransferase [Xanthomonadaceae bacterium NML91-0213]
MTLTAWVAKAIAEKIERDTRECIDTTIATPGYSFFEFFCGGGMARAGLGDKWRCLFANDFDPMKARVYRDNWDGGHELLVEDINKVTPAQLPGEANLVWASFPCQDLSLAGNYEGIGHWQDKEQTRSGTFWPFWKLMRDLKDDKRAPAIIVLENVYGVLTSNGGRDFSAIGSAFTSAGYRFGAMVIDARLFVPHSRPRVFVVGIRSDVFIPEHLIAKDAMEPWHPDGLVAAQEGLSKEAKKRWIWWNLKKPEPREQDFVDLIEDEPVGVQWHTAEQTKKIISMMSDLNTQKLERAKSAGVKMVGAIYKRTRLNEEGQKVQRAEVRFDDVAGCLRTPAGGSSRQIIMLVDGKKIRSRLISPRETARLMGLPDSYKLPSNYNDAYHVSGDGVAVPVVRHLAKNILEPVIDGVGTMVALSKKVA